VSGCSQGEVGKTHLEDGVLFFALELVGTEELETTLRLGGGQTLFRALEELEDVFNDNGLEIDLLLVVEILGRQLDL